MKFRSAYSPCQSVPCPSGSRYRQHYKKRIYDGKEVLEKAGVEDVFDSIQKAAPGNIIEDLLRRARNGDTSAIGEPVDSYVDLSHAPKDILEAHEMLSKARSSYDNLSADVKAVFDNDYSKFLEASVNGKAIEALNAKNINPEAKPFSLSEIAELRKLIGGNKDA